jgi:hypothetical protein
MYPVANDDITYIVIPLSTSNDDYCYFYFYFPMLTLLLLLLLFPMLRVSICLPPNLLLVPAMADMVSEVASQGVRSTLRWSATMSGFVLRRFVGLIGTRVKTDKGFKEIHLNSIAKNASEFCGQEVTGQQVYNHLRKWRSRCNTQLVDNKTRVNLLICIALYLLEHMNNHI